MDPPHVDLPAIARSQRRGQWRQRSTLYIYTIVRHFDRNILNKYSLYLLLGAIIFNLIVYIYIYNENCLLRQIAA